MLFLDGIQKTALEVAEMFNVPLDKIRKAPEFVINPEKVAKKKSGQSKEISVPAGASVPSLIFVNYKGKKLEFRYAEAVNDIEKADKWVKEYVPRKLTFLGMGKVVTDDNEDLMVFMYLHPACKQSPFRSANAKDKAMWLFKDLDQEGEDDMVEVKALQEALATIVSYSGEPLRIVAKALGISGTDKMNDASVQAQLAKIARNPHAGGPVEFNKKMNTNDTVFRGLIINGIDRGLFKSIEKNGRRRWIWGGTDKKGMDIVDIHDNGVPEVQTLIEYILSKIQDYYPTLMSAQVSYESNKTAEDFLSKQPKIDLKSMFDSNKEEAPIGGSSDETAEEDFLDENTLEEDLFPNRLDLDDVPEVNNNGSTRQIPSDTEEEAPVISPVKDSIPDFLKPKPGPNRRGAPKK